ncbi:MAG: DUF2141 domain-containing protein [Muribaculaceae bacterium]|nr:DUF2141 domain-containing protein [Muribaculaceae bacterium]
MKKLLLIFALIAICVSAKAETPAYSIIISELPYTEGTLYISAICGDKELLKVAIEVEEDSVKIPVDFSKVIGKDISIRAFQDLDEDKQLKFDSYGRPAEPFLQTTIVPKKEMEEYKFKLTELK